MADKEVSILVDIQSKLDGLDQTVTGIQEIEKQTASMQHALQIGFGVDIVRRFADVLASVPRRFQEAVSSGLEYNRMVQNVTDSTRALVIASQDLANDVPRAHAIATRYVRELEQGANRAGIEVERMNGFFARIAPVAETANIPMDRLTGLLADIAVGGQNMGISLEELTTRVTNMLAGNISSENTFARTLGIDRETMAAALEAGTVVDMFTEKLAAWQTEVEGADAESARLQNTLRRAFGQATTALFAALEGETQKFREAVEALEGESLENLGRQMARMVELGGSFARVLLDNHQAILALAKVVAGFGLVLGALKLRDLISQAGLWLKSKVASTRAITAETAALNANSAALRGNAAARAGGTAATTAGTVARTAGMARGGMAMMGGPVGVAVIAALALNEAINYGLTLWEKKIERQDRVSRGYREQANHLRSQMETMATIGERERVRSNLVRAIGEAEEDITRAILNKDHERVAIAERHLSLLQISLKSLDDIYERVADRNLEERKTSRILEERRALENERRQYLAENKENVQSSFKNAQWASMSREEQLAALRSELEQMAWGKSSEDYLREAMAMANREEFQGEEYHDWHYTTIKERYVAMREIEQSILQLEREISSERERQADEAERILQIQRSQQSARMGVIEEIQILEARVAGNDDLVKHLEYERDLRQEISRIVQATGVSEAEAANAASRKLGLLAAIEQTENRRPQPATDIPAGRGPGARAVSNVVRPFEGASYVRDGASAVGLTPGWMDRYEDARNSPRHGSAWVGSSLPTPGAPAGAQNAAGESADSSAVDEAGMAAVQAIKSLQDVTVASFTSITDSIEELTENLKNMRN